MRGFYVVFDVEMPRIGFAALADSLKDEPCNAACAGGTPTTPLTVDALNVDDPAPTPETPDVNPTAHVTVG